MQGHGYYALLLGPRREVRPEDAVLYGESTGLGLDAGKHLRDFRPENWRIQGGKSLEPFWERMRHAARQGYFVKPPARTVSLASNARLRHRYHRLSI